VFVNKKAMSIKVIVFSKFCTIIVYLVFPPNLVCRHFQIVGVAEILLKHAPENFSLV
jgi:hypothetical protein